MTEIEDVLNSLFFVLLNFLLKKFLLIFIGINGTLLFVSNTFIVYS